MLKRGVCWRGTIERSAVLARAVISRMVDFNCVDCFALTSRSTRPARYSCIDWPWTPAMIRTPAATCGSTYKRIPFFPSRHGRSQLAGFCADVLVIALTLGELLCFRPPTFVNPFPAFFNRPRPDECFRPCCAVVIFPTPARGLQAPGRIVPLEQSIKPRPTTTAPGDPYQKTATSLFNFLPSPPRCFS